MINSCYNWFKEARPEPTYKDLIVQTGVHFEEIAEMMEEMEGQCASSNRLLRDARHAINKLASALKSNSIKFVIKNDVAFLDSLADQCVTGVGVGHACGYNIPSAYSEVDRSNWSKFNDGKAEFLPNGKIAKSINYTPPALKDFV